MITAKILIGKTAEGEVVNLYTGMDGVELQAAADKAAKSGDFVTIAKVINPSYTPMPIDPTPTKFTKPSFPRPKQLDAPKQAKKGSMDAAQDTLRKAREARLAPSALKSAAEKAAENTASTKHADSKQEQNSRFPGGANVVLGENGAATTPPTPMKKADEQGEPKAP